MSQSLVTLLTVGVIAMTTTLTAGMSVANDHHLLSAAPPPTAPSICSWPDCEYIRLNYCLESPLVFEGCALQGTWDQAPAKAPLKKYGVTSFSARPVNAFTPTVGNCTWSYVNAHGNWSLFIDWTWAPLGDEAAGGGTNDVVDGETTQLGNEANVGVCFWMYYEHEGFDRCQIATADTTCTPASGRREKGKESPRYRFRKLLRR